MTSYVLEVVGAHEYWRFKDAKEKIQAQFPEGIEMNISKISRGRVVYALRARAEREELLRRLGGLPLRRGQLAIVATNDHSIRVEIQ